MFDKKRKRKLYIDFDGVIVDTVTPSRKLLEENNFTPKIDEKEIRAMFRDLNWFDFLKRSEVIPGSIEALEELIEKGYEVTVLTHINSISELEAKIEYLDTHVKDYLSLNIIGVPRNLSKGMIIDPRDNILVDDYSENLREWEEAGGTPIKFSKKQNAKFKTIDNLLTLLDISI